MALTIPLTLNLASGVALLAVALLIVVQRPNRRGAYAFAAFSALWGAEVLVLNSAWATQGESGALLLAAIGLALVLPQPTLLLHSATAFPSPRASRVIVPFAFVGVVAAGLFALRPDWFIVAGAFGTPLTTGLVGVPVFVASYIALGLFAGRLRDGRAPTLRREHTLLVMALGPYLAYTTGLALPYSLLEAFTADGDIISSRLYAATFALGALIVAVVVRMLVRERDGASVGLAAFITLAGVIGIVQGVPASFADTFAPFPGLFRLMAALFLGYALLKNHIFGIDRGLKLALKGTTMGGIVLAAFFTTSQLAEGFLTDRYGLLYGSLAVGIVFVFLAPIERVAERAARRVMPGVETGSDYEVFRKMEIYRGTLEAMLVDGHVTQKERGALDALATRLGIAASDSAALERDVRERLGMPAAQSALDDEATVAA